MKEECDHIMGIDSDYDGYTLIYKSMEDSNCSDREFKFCPDCGQKNINK